MSASDKPTTRSTSSTAGVDRLELALARADAADQWRSKIEAQALISRQRAIKLQHDTEQLRLELANVLERDQRAAKELDRLQALVKNLEQQIYGQEECVRNLQAQIAHLLEEPSIQYAVRKRLSKTPLGPIVRRLKQLVGASAPVDENGEAPVETAGLTHAAVEIEPDRNSAVEGDVSPDIKFDESRPTLLLIAGPQESNSDKDTQHISMLANVLARQSNVVVWYLGPSSQAGDLEQAAAYFLSDEESGQHYEVARQTLADICARIGDVDYALVVGTRCRTTLPSLAGRYIPTLALLPDDQVFAHSPGAVQEILFWSTHTSFTTVQATQQVRRAFSHVNSSALSTLAPAIQGNMPGDSVDLESLKRQLKYRFHSTEDGPVDAVVVGWGKADFLHGLDIFVSCADMVRRAEPAKRYCFLWVADDPGGSQDSSYPLLVQQQIERCNLDDRVAVLYQPLAVEHALEIADVLLFTARADTFQHIAVQGLQHGVPVIAFDQSSAVTEALKRNGFEQCLARYNDILDLAQRTTALLTRNDSRLALGQQLQAADWSNLTLDGYAGALMLRLNALKVQVAQERRDEVVIQSSGRLQPHYMGEIVHFSGEHDCSDARLYIKGWQAGIGARKPTPEFHPGVYAVERLSSRSLGDSFAHYLSNGCPKGPWQYPVISPSDGAQCAGPAATRVALHVHAYYPDMLEEILQRLRYNEIRPDLFISVRNSEGERIVRKILQDYEGKIASVQIVPNRGRDIGPFITTFGRSLIAEYEVIGHVHTKRSLHADRAEVEAWRNFLLENLLGGAASGAMMDTIATCMAEDKKLGVAFPADPVPLGWDGNHHCAEVLAHRMGISNLPDQFSFPAGTMFWIRAEALKPFVDLSLEYEDYPAEPLPIDGTVLHALERLFGLVPRAFGMDCALTYVPQLTR